MASSAQQAAISLRLALLDLPLSEDSAHTPETTLVAPIIARQRELSRRLSDRLCAVDGRIQMFLDDYLADTDVHPQLPRRTLVLDQPGLARELSLPKDGDTFSSDLLSSYRVRNGVLHNPANDRRTTAGVFHVAEGGLPIPDDKLAVPKPVFAQLLEKAFQPPADAMRLPYTSSADSPDAGCFVSLLLRPLVQPAVPGYAYEKRMEIRFIVPGGLVSNLDFVEAIFGNGGDPYLPENDASLDPNGWTGHTGLVVLAPHLTQLTKAELGLPRWEDATERQRRDGMAWTSEDERYNGGQAFKICARDERGVITTVIADNYFGYCKKEVKTQISYAANLLGCVEEEHAGGAQVFASHTQGQEFTDNSAVGVVELSDVLDLNPGRFEPQPEGHALDRELAHIVLVPAGAHYSLRTQTVSWDGPDGRQSIPFRADRSYLGPNGYRVEMVQIEADDGQWSIIGTYADSMTCHKPCTVSGGGKSEISKAITDAIIFGNAYAADFDADIAQVAEIFDGDYADRFADPQRNGVDHRRILDDHRTVGSVIKLLTPSDDFHDDYNTWLESVPPHIKELVYVVKRYYRPEWGDDWRSHFTVGRINGRLGNALRLDGDKIMVNMLRVGFEADGSWRLFGLRHDFHPAVKVQTEDDITASIVVPPGVAEPGDLSRKVVRNCEQLLFQRPDDAIHRGYDGQAEADIAGPGVFLSNFEPFDRDDAQRLHDDAIGFHQYTRPMRDLIEKAAANPDTSDPSWFVSSAHPRLVGGKPSKNPRYLQNRPDLTHPDATATAELASHLDRRVPVGQPLPAAVDLVAAGRRNNPPEDGVLPLCGFNPLHYLELPELFMEFISSMTGKSPSTTGAGSEGALTKGPFNAMPAAYDLNAAFLSFALTGYDGWISCAGYVGPHVRVDHDISLLVPEVFVRMTPAERSAANLIKGGYLEQVPDLEHEGRPVLSSRLGYRMTAKFATTYFGRIFMHPHAVFTPEMLRPELQDEAVFAESMATMVTTHERVARAYLDDGTISLTVPPLRALLEVMANGQSAEGWTLASPELRAMFRRDEVLASDWYAARIRAKQEEDVRRVSSGIQAMEKFVSSANNTVATARLQLSERLASARDELGWVTSEAYRESLVGTLGRQARFR